jgi:glycosyltransferase involved in cell wall biosynthesis
VTWGVAVTEHLSNRPEFGPAAWDWENVYFMRASPAFDLRARQLVGNGVPAPREGEPLRIAYLCYRGNPHVGGQGVYTRHLTREIANLGHEVEVFSGPPFCEVDEPVTHTGIRSMDLYPRNNPFRTPWPHEFHDLIDVGEWLYMCSAGFPEPWAFSMRVRKELQRRVGDFHLVHDNQCLGSGILGIVDDGYPFVNTLHHPITVDRDLDLAQAQHQRPWKQYTLRRWYAFLSMQMNVARQLPRHLTVSQNSRRDIIAQMGVPPERLHVVNVGVDQRQFRPMPHIQRVRGRLMTTASSDVPLKGLVHLVEALAKVRVERPDAHLVVIGRPRHRSAIPKQIERLGLEGAIEFVSGVTDERIVELYNEAEAAVVPSLYEGFSLPAIEAMCSGTPLVATSGGALPEVAGTTGDTALLCPPADPDALAANILRMLGDADLRAKIGEAGRNRVLDRFTWRRCAEGTVEHYYLELEAHQKRLHDAHR